MRILQARLAVALLIAAHAFPACSRAADDKDSKPPRSARTSEITSQWVQLVPSYRFASTSGFPSRAGEYDSLSSSIGGSLTFTDTDPRRHRSWQARADILSEDDYNLAMKFQLGKRFDCSLDARSLIHHLDNVPFGNSPNAGDIVRTDTIPIDALFGVKRTSTDVKARWTMSGAPVTLFVNGGTWDRHGTTQMRFFDMGGDAACASCHQTSRFRDLRYDMHHLAEGFDVKIRNALVTYEHDDRTFRDRRSNPLDPFGATTFGGPDPAPVNGVSTPPGSYEHNAYPASDTHMDTVRVRTPLAHDLTLTASASSARNRNVGAANRQDVENYDTTLTWEPRRKVRALVDYHQQNLLNQFTPGAYTFGGLTQGPYMFGNPSIHRNQTGLRLSYVLSKWIDAEAHYRQSNVSRSAGEFWPQIYSTHVAGNVGTIADPFTPRIVPSSSSDTVGAALNFHAKNDWSLRTGFDFTGTDAPGYLTDPQKTQRYFLSGTVTPKSWVTVTDQFTLQHEDASFRIQRRNFSYNNTVLATLRLAKDLPVSLGYSYFEDTIRTDMMLGSDPTVAFDPQSFIPYKGTTQTYTISTSYNIKKRLGAQLDWSHVKSTSDWQPDLSSLGADSASAVFASQFTRVGVPQTLVTAGLDYRIKQGMNAGVRFQYSSYSDEVHPELDGIFRSESVFLGERF